MTLTTTQDTRGTAGCVTFSSTVLDELRGAMPALEAWQRSAEGDFLALGEALIGAHGRLRAALDAMAKVGEAVLAPEGDRAIAAMRDMAGEARGLAALDRERQGCLSRLRAGARDAHRAASMIGETLRVLEYLAFLARVDVGTLEGSDRAALDSFVGEVTRLMALGRRTSGDLVGRLSVLGEALDQAVSLESLLAAGHRRSLEGVECRLAQLADRLEAHRREAHQAAAVIKEEFDGIWQAVGAAVQRMQVQDAARQRLEHAVAGIEQLLHVAAGGRLLDDGEILPPARRARAMRDIAAVAAAQLRLLADDLSREIGELRGSLAVISRRVIAAENGLRRLQAGGGKGAVPVLAELDTGMREIAGAFAAEGASRAQVSAVLDRCAGDARHLADAAMILKELEVDIRFAGLNAALRARRVDRQALATQRIAQEIRDHAGTIAIHTAAFASGTDALRDAARHLADEILPSLQDRQGTVTDGIRSCAGVLSQIEATSRVHQETAAAASGGTAMVLETWTHGFSPDAEGGRCMRELAGLLDAVAAGPPEEATKEPWPELDRLLRGAYTMQREREAHEAHGGGSVPAASPPAAHVAGDDLSDILF